VDIPQYLAGQAYKVESARVEMAWKVEETQAYAALSAFAEARGLQSNRLIRNCAPKLPAISSRRSRLSAR